MRYDAGEVITAMVTPFNEKREVDYEKVETLAYRYLEVNSSIRVARRRPDSRDHGNGEIRELHTKCLL